MIHRKSAHVASVSMTLTTGCFLAVMVSTAFADRQAVLGTVNSNGTFSTGRSAVDSSDGLIKESELRVQADSTQEHRLDAKCYHLRTDCYGDVIIPIGKFSSGTMLINWTADGVSANTSGQLTVAAQYGDQTNSGPFILNQSGSRLDCVKLRAVKAGGGASDQYYLYLQFDYTASSGANTLSASITTTADIVEEFSDASATTATLLPIFSSVDGDTKRFDFNKDVYVNSSKVLTETTAEPVFTNQLTMGGYLQRAYGPYASVSSGGLIAFGEFATASGLNAVALGSQSQAWGQSSTAMGSLSYAASDYSTAMGTSGAWAPYSTAMGQSSAAGGSSTAMGLSFAHGETATAMGESYAGGNHSTAMGYASAGGEGATAMGAASAGGNYSTAMGIASANGEYSTAMGQTTAEGAYSTAAGLDTTARAYASTALGRYNVAQGDPNNWVATDDLFVVGNGSDTANRSNALVVKKNGNLSVSGQLTVGGQQVLTTIAGAVPYLTTEAANTTYLKQADATASYLTPTTADSNYVRQDSTSLALGNGASSGTTAFAIGNGAHANGQSSTAMGSDTTAQAYASTILGRYNVVQGDSNSWVDTDDLFVIGNGTSSTPSNAMVVKKNGDTTVSGNAAIKGNSVLEGSATVKGNTVLEGTVTIAQPQGDISMGIYQ
jgi:hypothetical protein